MSRSWRFTRGATAVAVSLATLIVLAALASVAGAIPGTVTGITSPTHPDETTWYSNDSPSFAWEPALADGAAISGYSCVLDRSLTTVPDTVSDRNSLTYLPRTVYAVGDRPAEARIVDVNGDGKPDLLVENYDSSTLSVLLGHGDGTLAPKVDYATAAGPWSMAVGDVNGDGKTDVVTGNTTSSSASVLIGNGDGTFKAEVHYTTGNGTTPECLRMGDVNGDGALDIFTANAGTNNVSILLNNGNGTFRAPTTFNTATHPTSIDLSDLNGDGKQDLVTANYSAGSVSVLMGNGDGTFKTAMNYAASGNPQMILAADLNRDGKPDLATVNWGSNNASILLNNGDGTFTTAANYVIGNGPYAFSVIDLNQDSAPDLVTTNNTAGSVSILYGNGDGTFDPKKDLACGNGPFFVALGDLNGDGYGDLITTDMSDDTVSVFRGTAFLGASYTGKADGVWYFHVRAVNASGVGGATTTRRLRIDVTPPQTTDGSDPALAADGDSSWRQTGQTVTLSAADVSSGLAHTYYTLDGVQHDYEGPFTVSGDGSHAITYWSTDVAGNTETAHDGWVNIDGDAPHGSDASIPSLALDALSGWRNEAQIVALSAVDLGAGSVSGVAGIEYDLDDAGYVLYTLPFVVGAQGSHTLSYRAVDRAGNVETAHTAFIDIDLSPPAISSSADSDGAWYAEDVDVALTSGDEGGSGLAAVQYRRAGASAWTDVTGGGFTAPAAGENGPVSYQYRAVDGAGNETGGSCTLRFDTAPPTTTDDYAGGAAWQTGDVRFTLAATDATSGVAGTTWAVDGGAPQSGTDVVVSGDGEHTVTYGSTDEAGNAEAAHSVTVRLDATAPTTTDGYDGSAAWQSGDVHFKLDASDVTSGVAQTTWAVDDGTPQSGADVTVTGDGQHTVTYASTDEAGNAEDAHSVTVRIDATAPQTTDGSDPALAADGQSGWRRTGQTVSFSAADSGGSGLAGTYYTLDGTQHEYAAPFTVSGDGSHEITWWSTDAAGTAEATHTGYVNIWSTAPQTSASAVVSTADEGWRTSGPQPVNLTATGGHGAVAVHYVLDGAPQADAAGEATFDVAGDGDHELEYWATDELGNEETHHIGRVNIDTVAPVTTDDYAGGSAWQTGPVSFTLAATDATSGVAGTTWAVDGGEPQSGTDVVVSGDGEHTVTYGSTDEAGNAEAAHSVTVRIDAGAPATADDAPAGWRNADTSVALTPADALSGMTGGLATTTWELDGGATQSGGSVLVEAPSDHSGDGARTITYRSTDAAGNREADRTATVLVDTLAPTTRDDLVSGPPAHSDPVTVTLRASDEHGSLDVSGVAVTHYRVDEGPWQTGTSAEISGDGAHTLSYYSTDNAGNDEAIRTSASVTIATTPPGASSDDAPAGWVDHPVTLTLMPGARALSTTWELDGGASHTGASVEVAAPADHSGDGTHLVTYRSWAFGDVAEPTRTAIVRIDTRAPQTSDDAATGWHSGAVTLTLSPSDAASGVAGTTWSLDGGAAHPGTSVPVSGDGAHTVTYFSTDNAGNAEDARTATVHIDGTAPQASCTEAGRWFKTLSMTAAIAASDAGSGVAKVEYRLGGGDWRQGASVPLNGAGAHAISYRVTDACGNVATGDCVVGIDTARPKTVKALASKGKKKTGKLTLVFTIKDPKPSCGTATVSKVVVTTAKGRKVATIKGLKTLVKTNAKVELVVKKKLKKGSYRFKVSVTDLAGNTSKKSTPGRLVVK
jgi:FG-GAP-like repeat